MTLEEFCFEHEYRIELQDNTHGGYWMANLTKAWGPSELTTRVNFDFGAGSTPEEALRDLRQKVEAL